MSFTSCNRSPADAQPPHAARAKGCYANTATQSQRFLALPLCGSASRTKRETPRPRRPLKPAEIKTADAQWSADQGEERESGPREANGRREGGGTKPAGRGRRLPKIKSYLEGGRPKNALLLLPLNMDNDCLRLQNHKSEVPTATEQLARLPIIRIINHADFMVFKRGLREAARDRVRLAPPGQRGRLGREGKGRGRQGGLNGSGGGEEVLLHQTAGTKSVDERNLK